MNDYYINNSRYINESYFEAEMDSDITNNKKILKFSGLFGANGSGKSTTVNMISGVYARTAGEIFFEGKEINCET